MAEKHSDCCNSNTEDSDNSNDEISVLDSNETSESKWAKVVIVAA